MCALFVNTLVIHNLTRCVYTVPIQINFQFTSFYKHLVMKQFYLHFHKILYCILLQAIKCIELLYSSILQV